MRGRTTRFAIADYKTNWLAPPGEELTAWHHRPAALAAEMEHAHYALQALLYTVALHRYLRWRLPDYDPERNLAGVLYLFLRGMAGPTRPRSTARRAASSPGGRRRRSSRSSATCSTEARRERDRRGRSVRRPPRAAAPPGCCATFNDAGVLAAADVHVALRLAGLGGEDDEQVALAAALAVRAPRLGHVYVDLATIRDTATVDADEPVDLSALPWPRVGGVDRRLEASPLVAVGEDARESRPLRLVGTSLYLDRYWREERQVAADLQALGAAPPVDVDDDVLADGLARLFPTPRTTRQRPAAASAVQHRFAVVAGGPGTGKTTTVARIVALLAEQAAAAGSAEPLVALAAPTGKAAARLEEAVHEEAAGLDVDDAVRAQLLGRAGLDAAPAARLAPGQPQPLPPPPRQPAARTTS